MGLFDFLDGLFGVKKPNTKPAKTKKNPDDIDWETECESCGELLEDCECDNKELSLEDIAMMDMIDEDDELEAMQEMEDEEEIEDDGLDFDDFEELEDDDEDWF